MRIPKISALFLLYQDFRLILADLVDFCGLFCWNPERLVGPDCLQLAVAVVDGGGIWVETVQFWY